MFDQGNEPQDIFAETEPAKSASGATPGGIPRPAATAPGTSSATPVSAVASGPSKLIFAVVALVVVGGIGAGAYFWLYRDAAVPAADTTAAPMTPEPTPIENEPADVTPTPEPSAPETAAPTTPEPTQPEEADAPVDTDGDGLSDDQEAQLGTDPQRADTDDDGLSDREETAIYGTDPRNPDSDGDTYLDGEEVRAGYDPAGPGRLFTVPTTTP